MKQQPAKQAPVPIKKPQLPLGKPQAKPQQAPPVAQKKPVVTPTGYLILIRHGQRLDDSFLVTKEERDATKVVYELDIPLSLRGKEQAVITGQFLKGWFAERGIT